MARRGPEKPEEGSTGSDATSDLEDTQVLNRRKPPPARLVVVRASFGPTFAFWVAKPNTQAQIGRSAEADMVVHDPSVSRLHARIDVDARGALSIVDLRSTNGTFVNERSAEEPLPVELGDRVLVGAVPVSVERLAPAEVEALRRASARLGDADRDALTGLFSRRWLEEGLPPWIERHRRDGEALCCLFIDVDHFAEVNNKHRHAVGDRVLRDVAELVRKAIRDDDVAVRYGGDEVVVFLARCRLPVGKSVADRIRTAVRAHAWGDPLEAGGITLSIGVAQLGQAESAQAWMDRADAALYRAKEQRDRTVSD
jgi:diguanylate cyclase (GGDEF)-like protein